MKVPFVDLRAGIAPRREEYLRAIARVIDSAQLAGGPEVEAFEREFAALCAAGHAAAVSSGTEALVLALRAVGVGPGDEVITAANSFIATAEAIWLCGATPVFADVDDDTLLLDPEAVAARVTGKTRAIVPVHLFGQMADLGPILRLARERGLAVVEDAAQAHGATREGRVAGSAGDAAGFSFYPAKNLGALGEGGAVTTGSEAVAGRVRALRDHGQRGKHNHELVGTNARLPALLCACLRVSLAALEEQNASRRRIARRYREALAGVPGVRVVTEAPGSDPVYHLFVVRVAERDRVRAALAEAGVATAVHDPTPIHLQPAFSDLGHGAGDLPVTERAAGEILSLPMYPQLPDEAVDHVVAELARAVGR